MGKMREKHFGFHNFCTVVIHMFWIWHRSDKGGGIPVLLKFILGYIGESPNALQWSLGELILFKFESPKDKQSKETTKSLWVMRQNQERDLSLRYARKSEQCLDPSAVHQQAVS